MGFLQAEGKTMAFISGALTATGAETVYDTTVAITYCIDGKLYSKSTVANGVTPTTDTNGGAAFTTLTADQGCILVWGLEADGTVVIAQGNVAAIDGDTDLFKTRPQFPHIPDTMCPFAYQVLKTTGAAGTITIGTSNWNATGFSNVIVNCAVMPDNPQIA